MCLGVFQIAVFCLFRVTCRPRGAQCIWGLPQPALLTSKLPNFRVLVLGRLAPVLWERFSLCCYRCRFGTEGQSHQSTRVWDLEQACCAVLWLAALRMCLCTSALEQRKWCPPAPLSPQRQWHASQMCSKTNQQSLPAH